jgi:hypothetical protein
MRRLGGEVLTTENAREFSSAAKGETLEGELTENISVPGDLHLERKKN